MQKFWNWIRDDTGDRVLWLEGPIDEDDFWGDEVTPKAFRDELYEDEGDVSVWINSPGGSVFAAAEIYTMLRDYPGKVTVRIASIAASAASVVAMAGDRVLMSPTALLMVHDPMTVAMGNAADMEKAISTLNEVKESIVNAYQEKTGLSRNKISKLMSDETWLNARKAVELGFADEILFTANAEKTGGETDGEEIQAAWKPYSTRIMGQTILNRLVPSDDSAAESEENPVEAAGAKGPVEPPEAGVTPTVIDETPRATPENPPVGETEQPVGAEPVPSAEDTAVDPDPTDPSAETPEADKTVPPTITIGLDGKTKDGAMPYEILRIQLEFLK